MFFSRVRMNAENISANQLSMVMGQDGYQDHQMVWRFFPDRPDADRDFLFRKEQLKGWPCFYVVSVMKPVDTTGFWLIESKPYQPKLHAGQKLAFEVRANAVVTRWVEEAGRRRQVRHDVVMDAKKGLGFSDLPFSERPNNAELIQKAGGKWMQGRCQSWGFLVGDQALRVDGYSQQRVFKANGKRTIRFSTLEFTGLLTVDNPDTFSQTLFQGIGKSRGLGCGLLLVKPVRN